MQVCFNHCQHILTFFRADDFRLRKPRASLASTTHTTKFRFISQGNTFQPSTVSAFLIVYINALSLHQTTLALYTSLRKISQKRVSCRNYHLEGEEGARCFDLQQLALKIGCLGIVRVPSNQRPWICKNASAELVALQFTLCE